MLIKARQPSLLKPKQMFKAVNLTTRQAWDLLPQPETPTLHQAAAKWTKLTSKTTCTTSRTDTCLPWLQKKARLTGTIRRRLQTRSQCKLNLHPSDNQSPVNKEFCRVYQASATYKLRTANPAWSPQLAIVFKLRQTGYALNTKMRTGPPTKVWFSSTRWVEVGRVPSSLSAHLIWLMIRPTFNNHNLTTLRHKAPAVSPSNKSSPKIARRALSNKLLQSLIRNRQQRMRKRSGYHCYQHLLLLQICCLRQGRCIWHCKIRHRLWDRGMQRKNSWRKSKKLHNTRTSPTIRPSSRAQASSNC